MGTVYSFLFSFSEIIVMNHHHSSLVKQTTKQTKTASTFQLTKTKKSLLGRLLLKVFGAKVTKEVSHLLVLIENEGFQCSDLSYFSSVLSPLSDRLRWSLLEVNIISKLAHVYSGGATLAGGAILFLW